MCCMEVRMYSSLWYCLFYHSSVLSLACSQIFIFNNWRPVAPPPWLHPFPLRLCVQCLDIPPPCEGRLQCWYRLGMLTFVHYIKVYETGGDVYRQSMCGAQALWPSFRCNGSHMRGEARVKSGEGCWRFGYSVNQNKSQAACDCQTDFFFFQPADMHTSYCTKTTRWSPCTGLLSVTQVTFLFSCFCCASNYGEAVPVFLSIVFSLW